MNKKGISTVLVVVIVLLVVFVVLLKLQDTIIGVLKGSGEDQTCVLSTVLSASTKAGGFENIKIKCPMKKVHISMSDLNSERKNAKKKIENFNEKFPEYNEMFELKTAKKSVFTNGDDDKILLEYNLDKKIADEMKSCWKKMGQGELNLFGEWWKVLKYDDDTFTGREGYLMTVLKSGQFWKLDVKGAPKACVICSKITFDEDFKNDDDFWKKDFDSLIEWNMKHPISFDNPTTYYEFLKDDINKDSDLFLPNWQYNVRADLSVVFVRINVLYPIERIETAAKVIESVVPLIPFWSKEDSSIPIDHVFLTPYRDINQKCTRLMN